MEQKQEASSTPVTSGSSKKTNKKKGIFISLLVLILLGVGTYFAVAYFNKPAEQQNTTPAMTNFDSADAIIALVKPELQGTEENIDVATGLGGTTKDGYGLYGIASYKVGDRVFENQPTQSTGVAFGSDSRQAEENYNTITDFFNANHVKRLMSGKDTPGSISQDAEEADYLSYAVYETAGQLCMAWHVDASGTPVGSHVASLGCADKSSYEDSAKALDDFFAAYSKSVQAPYDDLVLGSPVTGVGAEGYEHAVVHQEDGEQFEGLYYRAKGETNWTYFLGVQGIAPCSEFTDDTVKKAFQGFECLGEGNKSTNV
jgi:hypothetical protein